MSVDRPGPWLAAILLVGLAIRLWAIDFGLPHSYHNDEIFIVRRALAFGTGDLNPHSFHWPAFHLYVMFALYGVIYVGGLLLGTFASPDDLRRLYFTDPTVFYLAGRMLSALLGTATIYLVYRATARLKNPTAGLWAAAAIALTYYHVRDSHLATLDVPTAFWTTWCFAIAADIFRDAAPSRRAYVAAGIAAGLATATKYNGGIVFLAVIAAHGLRRPRPRLSFLVAAASAASAAFLVATPYNWIDFTTFARDFAFQQRHLQEGSWGLASVSGWSYYPPLLLYVQLKNTLRNLFDPMILLFVAALIGTLVRGDRRAAWLTAVVPIAYVAYIARWGMGATRYLDLVFPLLAVSAGLWLERQRRPIRLLAVVSLALSLRTALLSDWVLSHPDTRTESLEWVEHNIPPATRIAIESYGPPLAPSPATLERRARGLQSGRLQHPTRSVNEMDRYYRWMIEAAPETSYDLVYLNDTLLDSEASAVDNRLPDTNYDLERLEALGVRYVILASFSYRRYLGEHGKTLYPRQAEFYRRLTAERPLTKELRPSRWQPGPTIRIFALGNAP